MKKLTNNQIIAKSLRIKNLHDAKYIDEIESMGLEFLQEDASANGYHSIMNSTTGSKLCLSKDMRNKARLYGNWQALTTDSASVKESLEKIDLESFLSSPRERSSNLQWINGNLVSVPTFKETKTKKYLRVKSSCESEEWHRKYAINNYNRIEAQIAELQKEQQRFVKREIAAENKIASLKLECTKIAKG
jgi:hypothetical protein